MIRVAVALIYVCCGMSAVSAIQDRDRPLNYVECAAVIIMWPSVITYIFVKTNMKDSNENRRHSEWQTASR